MSAHRDSKVYNPGPFQLEECDSTPVELSDSKVLKVKSQEEQDKAISQIKQAIAKYNIQDTLSERGSRYGSFDGHADITQRLKHDMVFAPTSKWITLTAEQKESLEMIAHKIGRILNGDPNYIDSWVDIAGYAQLVVNILEKKYSGDKK